MSDSQWPVLCFLVCKAGRGKLDGSSSYQPRTFSAFQTPNGARLCAKSNKHWFLVKNSPELQSFISNFIYIHLQVGRLPGLPSSNLMLQVLKGTDETIEIEDILNSKSFDPNQVPINIRFSNQFLFLFCSDQRYYGENNIEPHVAIERRFK